MNKRYQLFREAVHASFYHKREIDEGFIIDYLIEKLVYEQHRTKVLSRLYDENIKKLKGADRAKVRMSGLSLQRIFIPYLDRFDELFDYHRDGRLVVMWPTSESHFYLVDEYGPKETEDFGYWKFVGYNLLRPIFAAHGIGTSRPTAKHAGYLLIADRRRRAFYAGYKKEVISHFEVVCDINDQEGKKPVLREFPKLATERVLFEMEKELIRTYGEADLGPHRTDISYLYMPDSNAVATFGIN